MAKKPRRSKSGFSYKKNGVSLDFYGHQELLQKIIDAGGKLDDALTRSLVASSKPIENDLLGWLQTNHPRITGETEDSFVNAHQIDKSGGYISYKLGFDVENGGLVALYFDLGTKDKFGSPLIEPSYFVYYAFTRNVDRVKAEQEKELLKVFKELV